MTVFKIKQVNETIRTIYQELFILRFIHTGYETPAERFLSKGIFVEPDAASKQLFKDYRIGYRFVESDVVCFLQCDVLSPPVRALISVPSNLVIRFLIHCTSEFLSRTYVVAAGSKKSYLFSNQISNVSGFTFLSRPVQAYSSANDYESGTIVQNGGDLYATRQTVLSAGSIPITDASFWKKMQPTEQVVNNADLFDNTVVKPSSICFGVVDIHKNGIVDNSYKVFDTGDKLFKPAPVFTIKFASVI